MIFRAVTLLTLDPFLRRHSHYHSILFFFFFPSILSVLQFLSSPLRHSSSTHSSSPSPPSLRPSLGSFLSLFIPASATSPVTNSPERYSTSLTTRVHHLSNHRSPWLRRHTQCTRPEHSSLDPSHRPLDRSGSPGYQAIPS
ncbi:hypothetical protein BDW42DRAFT_131589 [Aspergillus taichungensis]|uniref:Uncharacterized protein n=1 Tax=Aspergillus taichungensis TaxID=482145 RepID=A0A2J5I733_9EURO|nr:hypothetical protein BDW42DRAFT_131589 [Aspergillus taichungensis]